ncbi:MAG: 2-oxoacid:acceptor oxidoreductase family protein [Bacilli bacterium]|jgi:2-oxoglutarate ferredoxin oxidoreductase subunit gamma
MNNHEIRLVGSGGQGVILATVILAEAAVQSGHYTAQSQSYGPEARGSLCKAETIISDKPIGFTKIQSPSFWLTLTQTAVDQCAHLISDHQLMLIDASLDIPHELDSSRLVVLPILGTAQNEIGKTQTANIVAVGCINELLGIADGKVIRQAVLKHVPKGTEELNLKALEAGVRLAQDWKKDHVG